MRKFFLFLLILILVLGGIAAYIVFGPATGFDEKSKSLYIATNATTKKAVLDSLQANHIINNETAFEFLADQMDYWERIRPGKYEIDKNNSLLTIIRKLRNGQQDPVDLTIKKLRTKEDFASLTGRKFEFDSTDMMNFLNSEDSLRDFGVVPEQAMFNVLPDTYQYYWSTSPRGVYEKLHRETVKFWDDEKKIQATTLGLSPQEVHILASIVEEETTNHEEKDTIASVYLNRLKAGMPLGADPTLKFATRDFGLKRIAGEILNTNSPYNTYKNKGLPPGPISTPSKRTIEETLKAPPTGYYYFVANLKLNGHLFSSNFEEHVRKANEYREADKKRREQQAETSR